MNWPDVFMALVLIVGLPGYVALVRFPRLKAAVAAGVPNARTRAYREGMVVQWILAAIALFVWLETGPTDIPHRTLSQLGLGFDGGRRFGIGLGVTLIVMVILVVQRLQITRDHTSAENLKKHMGHISPLLPHTPHELRNFQGISLTAGFCEEILYRGFLMGVLIPSAGLWGAVGLSSLFFGLGHAYQGIKGIVQTLAVGLVLALLYVLTGSLWLPMLLHGFLDWNSGLITYRVMSARNGADSLSEPA